MTTSPHDWKWQRLRKQRDGFSSNREAFSLLHGLLESLKGFQSLSVSTERVNGVLDDYLDTLEHLLEVAEDSGTPIFDELSEVLEPLFGQAELVQESQFQEDAVKSLIQCVEKADLGLMAMPLTDLYTRAKVSKEENRILDDLEQEVAQKDLEAGFFSRIRSKLSQALDDDAKVESFLLYLGEQHSSALARLENYNKVQLRPEDWTVRVALADHFMLEAFDQWLEGLELLEETIHSEASSMEAFEEALSLLREANRHWIYVERLAG